MNISAPFIQRPVMTTLLMMSLVLFGMYGYYLLPVSQLPDVDFPTIVVNANLPGASPETMANSVATPLEKRFATIAGVDSITSSSSIDNTQIVLQFSLHKSIDAAALDVQAAINASVADLPTNMLSPPVYIKINPAEAPILYLAMYSDTEPLFVVHDYAEKFFGRRISMINGVAQVNIFGSQKYATRIQLDSSKISAHKISLLEIRDQISKNNVNLPAGTISTKQQQLPIKVNGQLERASDYNNLIIAYRNNAPIKLNQVGWAIDSVENNKVASWFDDQRSIVLAIQRQPGSNTLAVIKDIFKEIQTLKKQLPPTINLVTIYDRSPTIQNAVQDVEHSLLISGVLVFIVILLFLHNMRAAAIVGVVLPLSIIGSFAFMQLLGFSLNIISLLGLTLVVGLVVDDAIVVLENIMRHLEEGKSLLEAAMDGAKQIGFTVISITSSLIVVFIPILFMGGIIGELFHQFAVTVIITIVLSALIALTLTPMLASMFLYVNDDLSNIGIFHLSEKLYSCLFNHYQHSLRWTLNHKKQIMCIFWLTMLGSIVLLKFVPKSFIPDQDIGNFIAFTEADPDVSFDLMVSKHQRVVDVIKKNPNVEHVVNNVGAIGMSKTLNSGFIIAKLKPYEQRKESVGRIIKHLNAQVNQVPGLRVFLQNIPVIPIGGRMTKGTYQYVLLHPNIKILQNAVELLQQRLNHLPQIQDLSNDCQMVTPQFYVNINRAKAAALGVSINAIETTLYTAFGNPQISTIYAESDTYKVILELLPGSNINTLRQIEVLASNQQLIPLGSIADISIGNELLTINHEGQVPAATISFNLSPGTSLGHAITAIEKEASALKIPGLVTKFSGIAETFKSSMKNLGILLIIVILVVYLLLGMLYESFIHPVTVLAGLPSAIFGALLSLIICKIDLDLYGFIGLIILIGIVKKNAIMMIDFAIQNERIDKADAVDAIYDACVIRFRPIMMTTFAAILGALPIALGLGQVAAATQRSLGVAVVGGLIFSQVLTLYITPIIYLYLDVKSKQR